MTCPEPETLLLVTYSTPPLSSLPFPTMRTSLFEWTSPSATVPSPVRSTAYLAVSEAAHNEGTIFGAEGPAPPTSTTVVLVSDSPPSSSRTVTVTV